MTPTTKLRTKAPQVNFDVASGSSLAPEKTFVIPIIEALTIWGDVMALGVIVVSSWIIQ